MSRSKILSALVLGGALAGPAAGQTPDVVKEVKTLVEATGYGTPPPDRLDECLKMKTLRPGRTCGLRS